MTTAAALVMARDYLTWGMRERLLRTSATRLAFIVVSGRRDAGATLLLCTVIPLQKCAKRRATMAVVRFFFRAQFGKRFLNCREETSWIVSESIFSPRRV